MAQHGGLLDTDLVQDGAHVVHPRLQRRQVVGRNPVREPGSALVEQDQA
jgi:hypothetical protein